MRGLNIAVAGATGMVGRKMMQVLEEQKLSVDNYYLFASERSAGKKVRFMDTEYIVELLSKTCLEDKRVDIALFSAGASTSREFAPYFAQNGCVVIDNSSYWRMDEDVPLVVPEANAKALRNIPKNIVANPNCSTIQAMVVLKPLHDLYGLKRVIYSTYQAVSGAGRQGYDDLAGGIGGESPKKFPYPIFGNCIPHIDVFQDDGYTKEEQKMIDETRKILGLSGLRVTATTVRVPVFYGHSESVNIEFERPFDLDELKAALGNAPGIIVEDDPANLKYPMPLFAQDSDEVFVGRIRRDASVENGINCWVVADNIRKGAATNTVQIAKELIKQWQE